MLEISDVSLNDFSFVIEMILICFNYLQRHQMKYKLYLLLLFTIIIKVKQAKAQSDSLEIYIFMSETCPICQNQTLTLKELYKTYGNKGISFIGIFPNTAISNDSSILSFAKKYKLPFTLQLDKEQTLTKKFSAVITPQAFLIRKETGEILYNGRIDNSFERVGKRRNVVTEFYLRDALDNILNHQKITLTNTIPVGCFISKN